MDSAVRTLERPAPLDRERLTEFVVAEMAMLDERRFEDWAALFTDDGVYWAPVGEDQESPHDHVSLFFDDRKTIDTRIMRLRHPRIWVQDPPSRTIHLTSNLREIVTEGGEIRFRCNFIMLEFRVTKGQTLYGGTYDYVLVEQGGALRIKSKKATLANSEDSFPSLAVWF